MRLAAITQSCWYIKAKIESLYINMLVDTGSAVTLVSNTVFEKLGHAKNKLKPVSTALTTADGDVMNVIGASHLSFSLSNHLFEHSAVVADLGDIHGILGLDFLSENDVQIDAKRGVLRFPDFTVQLSSESKIGSTCARVQLTDTVHLPAKSETFVRGKIEGDIGVPCGIIEPSAGFRGDKDIMIPKSIVNVSEADILFSVMNPTSETVILKKNAPVASLQPVQEITDGNFSHLGNSSDKPEVPEHLKPLVEKVSDKLTASEKAEIADVIGQFSDVFVGPDGKLGQTDVVEHCIATENGVKPIRIPPRRLPISQREVADAEINKMLNNGIIEPSSSPWSAPIVLVKKRDGSTRFCVDYRRLNSVSLKDSYPLPRIDDSLDSLSGAKYFCTLDLAQGFFQVKMNESDKEKTAFATHKGLFQFRVMPFGLANSPKTFERLMELTLAGLHWERCLVYIDDVIVFGKSVGETLDNLKLVFERFREANLKLKPSKCTFFQEEVRYLGHIVSADGIKCEPDKISAVENWPVPESVSDVRSFLGIASYYRKFIADFSNIAFPLTQLTRKDKRFEWTDDCQISFMTLKRALTAAPILAYPTRNDKFILDTDASNFGVGAVLSQIQDGEEKVIAYGSKTLSRSQRGYCTTYRELLAVVTFVKQFRYYLSGRHFLLRTDHSSLIWLKNFKEPEGMVARWLSLLDTYDFKIEHRRGNLHGNADALSRKPRRRCKRAECSQCREGTDCTAPVSAVTRSQKTVEPKSRDQPEVSRTVEINGSAIGESRDSRPSSTPIDTNWVDQWSHNELKDAQCNDTTISHVIDLLNTHDEKPADAKVPNPETRILLRQWDSLRVENGLLYRVYENGDGDSHLQFVTPRPLRHRIMHQLHNVRTAAHLGRDKTLNRIKSRFYWPGMTEDVARWCQSCLPCQMRKPGPGVGRSPMQHCTVYAPMECIAIDIMGPLPTTDDGNRFIMVLGDYFSKWTEAYALPNHTAQAVADKLVTEFICRFGAPMRIHTDQGPEFESHLFARICELLDIEKSRTTPYRPQSDGMIERFNRTLLAMLSMFVSENKDDWDDHLPYLCMAYRASVQESTKCTPNLLMLGHEVSLPLDVITGTVRQRPELCPSRYVEWVRETIQRAFDHAHEQLQASFARQKRYYDHNLKVREYDTDSPVLRWYPPEANQKLGMGFIGPYKVVRKINEIHYEIERCSDSKRKIVHVDHLKPLILPMDQTELNASASHSSSDLQNDSFVTCDNFDDPDDVPRGTENSYIENGKSLVHTRTGRLIKPRQLYSP